jgi:DNA-binding NtrC family response regulator
MAHATVLVVDDEMLVRWSLKERLAGDGYEVLEAATAATALEQARKGVDLVLLDFRLPDSDGLAVLERVKELYPDTLVILMTTYSTIDNAVEAIQLGAFHYINKPFDVDEVAMLVERALETRRPGREVKALRTNAGCEHSFDTIVGRSPALQAVKALLASALRLLEGHRRPGNIRELRTAIERAMVLIHR